MFSACTDLSEKLYSTLEANNFYKNKNQCILAMGNAYSQLQYRGSSLWGLMGTELVSTDEAVIPYRTQGPFLRNNGLWIRLHQHNFHPNDNSIKSSWEYCFNTAAACNQVIYEIEKAPIKFDTKPNMVAELKVLRAYAYYVAMDLYGNIPISLDFRDTTLPKQYTRSEAFKTIEKEIKDNLDLLDAIPSVENYGRCTKSMAFAVLAKMYLNADVWLGTPMWKQAISMCDSIIIPGYYHLESNYFKNFAIDNEDSRENIFVIPYDRKVGWGLQMHEYTLHPSFAKVFNISAPIWNGMSATESFYDLYDSADIRINSWMVGPQYDQNGQPLTTTSGDPLVFTPKVNSLRKAGEADGVRCKKWEFPSDLQKNESMDNDWVIFRYADILLMKAEAIMRMNGGIPTQEAVDLVNQVRERAFGNSNHDYTMATLDLHELLNERGRELAWELHRRQDLIRFGKWEKGWFGHPPDEDKHIELLPIPGNALSANPNLEQNPGY